MPRYDVAPLQPDSRAAPAIVAAPLPAEWIHTGRNPRQFWAMLRTHAGWIAGCAIAVGLLTALATRALPKTYEATAGMLISYEAMDPQTGRPVASFLAPSYLATQLDLLSSPHVLLEVVDRLGWVDDPARTEGYTGERGQGALRDYLAQRLERNLEISSGSASRLVTLTYADADAATAAKVANLVGEVYLQHHGHFSQIDEPLVATLRAQLAALEARDAGLARTHGPKHPTRLGLAAEQAATRERLAAELDPGAAGQDDAPGTIARRQQHANAVLASPASVPLKPSRPTPMLNLLAGLLAGAILGLATALLRELLHRRVHCRDDVEREMALPVLAEIGGPARLGWWRG